MFMLVLYTDLKAKNSKVKSISLFKTIGTEAEVQSQKQLFKTITVVTSVSLENLMGEGLITKLSFLNISGQHNCRRGWG